MKKLSMILVLAGTLSLFSCKPSTEQKENDSSSTSQQDQKDESEKTSIEVSKDGVSVESEKGDNKTSVTISKDSAGVTIQNPPK